jgi:putative toxin-antitoxin system antitoxin component (TIGR02293 family)
MDSSAKDFLLKEPYSAVYEQDMPSMILAVRRGIGYDAFRQLVSFSLFNMEEWSRILHLTERSLQRYKKENKTFDSLQSEKIMQIMQLYKRGIEVFGTKELFDSWLDTVIPALGHIKPKEILDSSFGIEMIKDELTRIEHGVLA